jgi:hypothetical protein
VSAAQVDPTIAGAGPVDLPGCGGGHLAAMNPDAQILQQPAPVPSRGLS